jgi:hypothetical protein
VYALIWTVLAVGFQLPARQIVALLGAPWFVVLAALPGLGAVLARYPLVGAAIGGAVPLVTFAMYNLSDPAYTSQAPPLAWFVFSAVVGALFGVAAGGTAIGLARAFRLPLPREAGRK